jgi:putative sporulation protein YtaF
MVLELLSYIFFALALNLDSFGAGVAYGARQIKVPVSSLCIISLISMAAISISMLGGQILLSVLPVSLGRQFGGLLLIAIGFWVLYQTRRSERRETEKKAGREENSAGRTIKIHIRPLGLVIQILKEPVRADLDSSGVISPGEAFILGIALAMDAFAPDLRSPCSAFPSV